MPVNLLYDMVTQSGNRQGHLDLCWQLGGWLPHTACILQWGLCWLLLPFEDGFKFILWKKSNIFMCYIEEYMES